MKTIGFIGIGKMGKLMIEHLIKANYTIYAHDINKNELEYISTKGALVSPSISNLAENSDIVILMLPNSKIVESVILGNDGLLENMRAGQIIVDMSSSDMNSTIKLAKLVNEKGIDYVDAPVSGGKKGAAEASLTIMVGGKSSNFNELHAILKCMGDNIIHIGEVGHGHALKAINNFLSATSLYASSEAMIIANSIGLDLQKSLEVINGSSGQSYSTLYKLPNFILKRKFKAGFSLDLMLKDIKLSNSLARENGIPIMLGSLIEQVYEAASTILEEECDHTEIAKFIEIISNKKVASEY